MKTLWLLFVIFYAVMSVLSMFQGDIFAGGLSLVGAAGAFSYLRSKRVVAPVFWALWLVVFAIDTLFSFALNPKDVGHDFGAGVILIVVGFFLLLNVPIILAVYRYARGQLHPGKLPCIGPTQV